MVFGLALWVCWYLVGWLVGWLVFGLVFGLAFWYCWYLVGLLVGFWVGFGLAFWYLVGVGWFLDVFGFFLGLLLFGWSWLFFWLVFCFLEGFFGYCKLPISADLYEGNILGSLIYDMWPWLKNKATKSPKGPQVVGVYVSPYLLFFLGAIFEP